MFSLAITLGGANSTQHYRPLPVTAALRGYAAPGDSQLLRPGDGKRVSVTALALRFCPTRRDLFLERTLKAETLTWERSVLGHVVDTLLARLHQAGLDLMEDAFESAVAHGKGPDLLLLEQSIAEAGRAIAGQVLSDWTLNTRDQKMKQLRIDEFAAMIGGPGSDLVDKTHAALLDLVHFETRCLAQYLRKRRRLAWLLPRRDWMAEARATIGSLRAEVQLDSGQATSLLGLSGSVRPDFVYAVLTLGDIKTGDFHRYYETVATSYAIFAEHVYKRRINTAAILSVAIDIAMGTLKSHAIHIVPVDSDRRQLWLTQRDLALSVVRSDRPPDYPSDVSACNSCTHLAHCWENAIPGGHRASTAVPVRTAPGAEGQGR